MSVLFTGTFVTFVIFFTFLTFVSFVISMTPADQEPLTDHFHMVQKYIILDDLDGVMELSILPCAPGRRII